MVNRKIDDNSGHFTKLKNPKAHFKKINDDDHDDRVDDLPVERFTRATSKTSVGASLRASTRGELRSSMLNRSIRSRVSVRSLQQQRQDQMSACV